MLRDSPLDRRVRAAPRALVLALLLASVAAPAVLALPGASAQTTCELEEDDASYDLLVTEASLAEKRSDCNTTFIWGGTETRNESWRTVRVGSLEVTTYEMERETDFVHTKYAWSETRIEARENGTGDSVRVALTEGDVNGGTYAWRGDQVRLDAAGVRAVADSPQGGGSYEGCDHAVAAPAASANHPGQRAAVATGGSGLIVSACDGGPFALHAGSVGSASTSAGKLASWDVERYDQVLACSEGGHARADVAGVQTPQGSASRCGYTQGIPLLA